MELGTIPALHADSASPGAADANAVAHAEAAGDGLVGQDRLGVSDEPRQQQQQQHPQPFLIESDDVHLLDDANDDDVTRDDGGQFASQSAGSSNSGLSSDLYRFQTDFQMNRPLPASANQQPTHGVFQQTPRPLSSPSPLGPGRAHQMTVQPAITFRDTSSSYRDVRQQAMLRVIRGHSVAGSLQSPAPGYGPEHPEAMNFDKYYFAAFIVCLCFNPLFGIIAIVLAAVAQDQYDTSHQVQPARGLAYCSAAVSIAGVVVGITLTVVLVMLFGVRR